MEGTGFTWVGHVNAWRGKARVYVDDVDYGIVDQYIYTAANTAFDAEYLGFFKIENLGQGQNRIRIEVLGEKATQSEAAKVTIDRLIIR